MKQKLFNIHKLIGINVLLLFFISLFFGILTIFQPFVNLWEDPKQHITTANVSDINLDKCIRQVTKRTYFGEDGKKIRNDIVRMTFPIIELRATNLIRVDNRPNLFLEPQTCKRVRPNNFTISQLFQDIHTGLIFKSLLVKIIFGFMSVAVVFLCLSGLYLIIKNNYKNTKTKTAAGFFAKYHRLLLLYTFPLVFMFGLTGALFNLGVYSTPLITHYLTNGETINVMKVEKNILFTPPLETPIPSEKTKTISLNELYEKAQKEFDDIVIYSMHVYNHKDINARVKFIGYEPHNYFISSMTNKSYIVLDGVSGEILDKKSADQGSFTEKTLDAIFYLHYIRTFENLPRLIFGIIAILIFAGTVFSMNLWLERANKDKFTFKVLKPLSLTIALGSLVSASSLFAITWIIPKAYSSFTLFDELYFTHEFIFYITYLLVFIYIFIKKDSYKTIQNCFYFSSLLLLIAFISHNIFSEYTVMSTFTSGMYEIFIMDVLLIIGSLLLFVVAKKLSRKYKKTRVQLLEK